MSTTTGPNLAFAKQQVEKLMDDTCRVYVTTKGPFDANTGTLTESTETIYEGRCMVTTRNIQPAQVSEGGSSRAVVRYSVALPIDSATDFRIDVGAWVTVTSSRRDPHLSGTIFRVLGEEKSTFALVRRLMLEERQDA